MKGLASMFALVEGVWELLKFLFKPLTRREKMKCFVFQVEGLAPQYVMADNAGHAYELLLDRLHKGNDAFGKISEGVEVNA